ncbi:MAG: YihY/virulence factor BrkB family protein [Candidatus Rokuibacteriota bacterium]
MLGGLRGAFSRFFAQDGFFLAAGLAFFFLICVIPLVLLGVSLVGFFLSTEQAAEEVVGQLTRNFPVYKSEITRALLRIAQTRNVSGLVGTAILVLFSTSLFASTRLVLHRMLGVRGGRSLVSNLVVDALMVLLLGVLLFATTAGTWLVQWFHELVLEPQELPSAWVRALGIGLSVAISTTMFYLGYRYVPYRRVRVGPALAGALLAGLLWEVAKQLFRLYIVSVGLYDQIYGPLSVLVAFVMFVYYSAVVFVFGAAYVAALDARKR